MTLSQVKCRDQSEEQYVYGCFSVDRSLEGVPLSASIGGNLVAVHYPNIWIQIPLLIDV